MLQMFKRVSILFLLLFLFTVPVFSAIKSGVEYQIPIEYKNLNRAELEGKAEFYYDLAIKNKHGEVDDNMTSALNLYTILSNQNPEDPKYTVKLGKLYEIARKDRYSKGNYYRAISINNKKPEAYFDLGEYFYNHEQYRKALKMYLLAYKNGYSNHYQTLYKLGDTYQKLGDINKALEYLRTASRIEPSEKIEQKITILEQYKK